MDSGCSAIVSPRAESSRPFAAAEDAGSVVDGAALAMALNVAPVIIPAHDAYLAERCGQEFEAYAGRTKKLIPFLY